MRLQRLLVFIALRYRNGYSKYKRDKSAIVIKKRGRRSGEVRRLIPSQERQIIRWLIDSDPAQLKFKFALWTRDSVRFMIKEKLGKELPISTVGDYLKRCHFTSKKPIKRAYERKDIATNQWLKEDYPQIKKEAEKQKASIWWCDETACQTLPNNLKGYALIGTHNKPILTHTARKIKINLVRLPIPVRLCFHYMTNLLISIGL